VRHTTWVTMWWNSEDGEMDGHGIGLAPSEMELLSPGRDGKLARGG
jgi:hypothetical protein